MDNNMFDNIFSLNWEPSLSLVGIFKIPLILALLACIFYAFMLFLRTKILVDTVESEGNSNIKILVLANLFVSLIIGIIGTIIIVLG